MAFAIRNLSVLAYANNFTLWHYKSAVDGFSAINGEGYFSDASDMMGVGDMVLVTGAEGGRVLVVTTAELDAVATTPIS